jgi:hypothetical protein
MTNTPAIPDPRRGATSASNAAYDLACPGRHLAQQAAKFSAAVLKDEPLSEDAEFGRRIHAALTSADRAGVAGHHLSLAEREQYDRCREVEAKLFDQFFVQPDQPGPDQEQKFRALREQRFWARVGPKGSTVLFEHSGQPDVVFRKGVRALIVEYKTLLGDVPGSPRNQQLRDQAVLVWRNVPLLAEIAVAVVQPLVTMTPEVCVYTGQDLARAEEEMFNRVLASNDPKSPRVPGELQCKFCMAKSSCAEYQKWVGSQLPLARSIVDKPLAEWDGPDMATFCNGLSVCQKFLDDGKDWVKEALKGNPSAVPGWGLDDGRQRETITDPQACFDRFAAKGGDLAAFMGVIAIGKTKLREAVAKAQGVKGRSLDQAMDELLTGIVEIKTTAPSLKRVA